jgi:2'-5' RNA ligase
MRLFTGIALPESVIEKLSHLLDSLRPTAHLNWSPISNLHITAKFIGQWPEDRLDELMVALRPISNRMPVPISIKGMGWLPNAKSARVLYAGIEAGENLYALAAETDEVLGTLGVEREKRKYAPHLTLARIKDPSAPLADLRRKVEKFDSTAFGHFTAGRFHLYLSKPGPAGSIYTQLAEFPFTNE